MAVVSVTAQNTRIDDAENAGTWADIGGGGGSVTEPDFKYQGSNCVSRKGASGQRGFYFPAGTTQDLSVSTGTYQTVMFKYICTTPGLLELSTSGNLGQQLQIGSSNADFQAYDVQYSDTYPAISSFLVLPIDPNVLGFIDSTTGGPVLLTAIDYYGIEYDQTGVSKAENQGMDAIDIGSGLTLVGGDGADPDGTWQDFSDFDFGTSTNRFGYVRELDGIYFMYGTLQIGSATATVFNDSGQTLTFPDGLFGVGFSGIGIDLQNATTDVDFSSSTFLGQGTSTTSDTRPIITVTGTSGSFLATGCVIDNFADVTLTSASELNACLITRLASMTLGGGTLDSCDINDHDTATGIGLIQADSLANISGCAFDNTGGTGHAIQINTAGTYNFSGNLFTGYGGTPGTNSTPSSGSTDAAIYNNSGGAVTINITNSGDTPSIRNGASATTTVNNNVSITLTGIKTAGPNGEAATTEIRVYRDSDNVELAGTESSGSTFNFSVASGTAINIVIHNLYYVYQRIPLTPTADSSIPIQQVVDRNYDPV